MITTDFTKLSEIIVDNQSQPCIIPTSTEETDMTILSGIAAHHMDKKASINELVEWESDATVFICERGSSGNLMAISGCHSEDTYGVAVGDYVDFYHQGTNREHHVGCLVKEVVQIEDKTFTSEFDADKVIPWYVLKQEMIMSHQDDLYDMEALIEGNDKAQAHWDEVISREG